MAIDSGSLTSKQQELQLLLEAIYQTHGYDFRQYAPASMLRRCTHLCDELGVEHISELIPKIFHQSELLDQIISSLTISVSELFRDPFVFSSLRKQVIPYLATFAKIRIWVAGCASGEEAYSLAILLQEEGLLKRTQIYASDICPTILEQAKTGILRQPLNREDAQRYQAAGGQYSLSDYFVTQHGHSKIHDKLLSAISFHQHNLVNEAPFVSPELLLCRNVLIYFNKKLQNQIIGTFSQNLSTNHYLVLGPKEDLQLSPYAGDFKSIDQSANILRKIRHGS